MDSRIFKYELEVTGSQTLLLPRFSEILCVQTQFEKPCIWALVNPEADKVPVSIEIYGTGENIVDGRIRKYIGTFQIVTGEGLVFHVFELLKTKEIDNG